MNFTLQVLTTLRFLAKGGYLSEVADMHGIPLSSASRIIHSVCSVLCLCLDNIKFPTTHQLNRIKHEFCAICNFPNVVGAIDDTLILEWPVKRNLIFIYNYLNASELLSFKATQSFHFLTNRQGLCTNVISFILFRKGNWYYWYFILNAPSMIISLI